MKSLPKLISSKSKYLQLTYWLILVALAICLSGGISASAQELAFRFSDFTQESGVTFVHSDGGEGKHYLFETVTGGLATLDYDNDGLMDIFFTSGAKPNSAEANAGQRLYRNQGCGKFRDVTEEAGISESSFSLGVVVGDIDNDGDSDLFVNNFGTNSLHLNNGDGTFDKLTSPAIEKSSSLGAGCLFLDIDRDGDLDLWVGNYVKFDFEKKITRQVFGQTAAAGPKDYPPEYDELFLNNGDGTFQDISESSGIRSVAGTSMGMVSLDFDRDGDCDVFVCNDGMENFLWQNDGKGYFSETALESGVAFDFGGLSQASMGVDCADINHDGWLDLVATNFDGEVPNVYVNSKGHFFDDLGPRWGMGAMTRDVKWGVVLSDFNRDGTADLFIATGHLFDGIVDSGSSQRFASPNRLFQNLKGQRFVDASNSSSPIFQTAKVSRGCAAEDLDNDGDMDLIVLNLNDRPTLISNDSSNAQWLKIRLIGRDCNRDAVGSRVTVYSDLGEQAQEVHAGRGYQSHYGSWLFFGLGAAAKVREVEIQWVGGKTQRIASPLVDTMLTVVQSTD